MNKVKCPTCGTNCAVNNGAEGTGSFIPADEEIERLTKERDALIKVINDSVKDTAFPHKLYEALIDGDTRKMKPIGEIVELAQVGRRINNER